MKKRNTSGSLSPLISIAGADIGLHDMRTVSDITTRSTAGRTDTIGATLTN